MDDDERYCEIYAQGEALARCFDEISAEYVKGFSGLETYWFFDGLRDNMRLD